MVMKIIIGTSSGKSFQKELPKEESQNFHGRKIGEKISGDVFGISGCEFEIRGGSDAQGFPMRSGILGDVRKKIFITKGVGFRGKLRGKRFKGLRVKRTVFGNTISSKTHQVNLKCIKGDEAIEKQFKKVDEKKTDKK